MHADPRAQPHTHHQPKSHSSSQQRRELTNLHGVCIEHDEAAILGLAPFGGVAATAEANGEVGSIRAPSYAAGAVVQHGLAQDSSLADRPDLGSACEHGLRESERKEK